MTIKLFLITCVFFSFNVQLYAQDDWVSPCPRLFVYESTDKEPNKWYGIATLLSDTTLSGVWMRLIFTRPVLSLGNWFGEVKTEDHKSFLVKNPKYQLKAYEPKTVRFYVEYDQNEPPPKLDQIRLNAKQICPEQVVTEAPPITGELQTSGNIGIQQSIPYQTTPTVVVSNPIVPTSNGCQPDDSFLGDFDLRSRQQRVTTKALRELNGICGTVVTQPAPLITYGQATRPGEYPWHAALYINKGVTQMYICGASLISHSHVLTAAHCVTRSRSSTSIDPDDLIVYLGKHSLKLFVNDGVQALAVSRIMVHPKYSGNSYKNDISVLKLTSEARFTDYVRPVCLWKESPDIEQVLQKLGTVIGWGFDETGKLSQHLMQAKMPIVSESACLRSLPEFYTRFTSENTFCAGFKNGTSVCSGDSGGSMVLPRTDSKDPANPVWQIRGFVSISVALQGQGCDPSNYVVFTDVAKYLCWIQNSLI